MRKMKLILVALGAAFSFVSAANAADCGQALFNPDYGVFAHEGGYQNSRNDPGNFRNGRNCGGTKYGWSCRSLPPGFDVRGMTKDQATALYEKDQCRQLHMEDLKGQRVPTLMLDLAVNMGTETAIKFIIKTLCLLEERTFDPKTPLVMTDAIIDRYNAYTVDIHMRREFMFTLVLIAIDHYCDIVQAKPKQAQWLLGWIVRVNPLND